MNAAFPPAFFVRWLCLLFSSLLAVSCTTHPKKVEDWNASKIWQQVNSTPPTYVPTGYGASRPRTDHDGTWFTDKRDGKRVLVPNQSVRGWEHGVLVGEAKKVTGYDDKPRLSPGQKIWWGIIAFFAAMGDMKLPLPD
jgi:hypothetical protein